MTESVPSATRDAHAEVTALPGTPPAREALELVADRPAGMHFDEDAAVPHSFPEREVDPGHRDSAGRGHGARALPDKAQQSHPGHREGRKLGDPRAGEADQGQNR
jgi:hypothetical protein